MSGPSVCIVSYADTCCGALLGARRRHRTLIDAGITSRMRVAEKRTTDPTVFAARSGVERTVARARYSLAWLAAHRPGPGDGAYHRLAMFPTRLQRELDAAPEDVLHLHWLGGEMLSVGQIARLTKPVLWTLHDEWVMRGAHRTLAGSATLAQRLRSDDRRSSDGGLEVDRWVWNRKHAAWRWSMTAVFPSRWLTARAGGSVPLHHWRIEVVPKPIDTDAWRPRPQLEARAPRAGTGRAAAGVRCRKRQECSQQGRGPVAPGARATRHDVKPPVPNRHFRAAAAGDGLTLTPLVQHLGSSGLPAATAVSSALVLLTLFAVVGIAVSAVEVRRLFDLGARGWRLEGEVALAAIASPLAVRQSWWEWLVVVAAAGLLAVTFVFVVLPNLRRESVEFVRKRLERTEAS